MKYIYLTILITLTIRLVFGMWFPVTQDEAYYFSWSRALDFGYFDHPPFIAWLVSLGNLKTESVLMFRLLGIFASILVPIIFVSILKMTGIKDSRAIFTGIVLTCFNLGALVFGFLQTPDLPLIVFWSLALHEAIAALSINEKRWLSAGIFTGLGFLSKYTMVLIGLVFFFGLIKKRQALRSPWPYLGGLCFILIITPHLLWNYHNDWVSIKFQLGRGFFSQYHVDTTNANQLPGAIELDPSSDQAQLANFFLPLIKPPTPSKPKTMLIKRIEKFLEFLGGQIALWGTFLVAFILSIRKKSITTPSKWTLHTKSVTYAACFIPLLFFGIISPFQRVEANWPAAYMVAGAVILTHKIRIPRNFLYFASACNLILVSVLLIHTHVPFLHRGLQRDRILKETHGYKSLASHVSKLNAPVFADTYQNTSMLLFYDPSGLYMQWPGITRMSELIRRDELVYYNFNDLVKEGRFYLVTNNFYPPLISDFSFHRLWKLFSCIDGSLDIIEAFGPRRATDYCKHYVQSWTLVEYELSKKKIKDGDKASK